MPRRRLCFELVLSLLLGLCSSSGHAQTSPAQAADLLIFGGLTVPRAPSANAAGESFADAIAARRALLLAQPDLLRQVAARAAADAFGASAGATVAPAEAPLADSYVDRMQLHLAALRADPARYQTVIQRAYRFVINRDAYPEEIAYWRDQPDTLTYVLLVACIEDWARRNQPGLMVTAGQPTINVNCEFLRTARLYPTDVAAVREACGLPPDDSTTDHRVIAVGAAHLASSGGIHFIAVGADAIAP